MAGGAPVQSPEWGNYVPTKFAKQGDHGSVTLPEIPTATVWTRGATAEVTWQVTANHGGGYYFRLCKSDEPLTEACFQRTPVPFAGATQKLVWADPAKHPPVVFNGTFVSEGTRPAGSTWAMNPLPYSNAQSPPQFPPPCAETVDRKVNDTGVCSGRFPYDVNIVDTLAIPADTPPGKYVLGLRWDCEKSAQVWSSCADVTIQ